MALKRSSGQIYKCGKIAVAIRVPETTQKLVISRSCFSEDGTCTTIDVLVAVVVVVCLSFRYRQVNLEVRGKTFESRLGLIFFQRILCGTSESYCKTANISVTNWLRFFSCFLIKIWLCLILGYVIIILHHH